MIINRLHSRRTVWVTIMVASNDLNTEQNKFLDDGRTEWFGSASASASRIKKAIQISVHRSEKTDADIGVKAMFSKSPVVSQTEEEEEEEEDEGCIEWYERLD